MEPQSSVSDIDRNIARLQNSLSLYPRSHSEHINCVNDLFYARWERFQLSQEKEDHDTSIVHCTEAIFLPHVRGGPPLNNILHLLFALALSLLERYDEFEQPEGVNYSIEYLRYLRRFPSGFASSYIPRTVVTTTISWALLIQVTLGTGNGTQNIKEMVVLCNELLSSSIYADSDIPTAAFMFLRNAAEVEFDRGLPIQILDEVIGCLRDAVTRKVCPPDSYKVLHALADTLSNRFIKTHSNEDYEEATALLERIIDLAETGECPDSESSRAASEASSLLIGLAYIRSAIFRRKPEYSEVLISRLRAKYNSPFIDEEGRLQVASELASEIRSRFEEYSLTHFVDASSSSSLAKSAELSGPSGPEPVREIYSATDIQQKIEHLEDMLSITPPGTEHYRECLGHLKNWYESKFRCTHDISDIDEFIKYSHLLLCETHAGHPWRVIPLLGLCNILHFAFQETRKIRYLDESITYDYNILELKAAQHHHFIAAKVLVESLLARERLRGGIEDRHEAIRLILAFINDPYAQETQRFQLSCRWAIIARDIGHHTTFTAYKTAMSLMQSPCLLPQQYPFSTLVLSQWAKIISLRKFEEAIETLEQGRALLWSEMRGLRTPVVQLIEDSSLAKRFAQVNQELEVLTISATPGGSPELEDDVAQGIDGTDPFGQLVIERKNLLEERDALILQVRGQPGLEGFLKAPSFTALRSAASRGPVVIINHCKWRSDIMIVFHDYLPCSIPTLDGFYDRANKLRDELAEARKHGLDSSEYQDALCSVLKGLYELVGEPVIKRLRLLGVPKQSRIWLCPTSVFCSLPLHAMGPIPSSGVGKPRYFSDLYIPSYTPSLSALIESRRTSLRVLERPSLLLVAQPEDSLPGVTGEIKVILERAQKSQVAVTRLVSSDATPISVIEGLRGSQLAHFACHGVLEAGKPFEASFKLHEGSHLTLLYIVRSQLPDAEFAFLSCCHAAEITAESVSYEALHLTAAMQYCGFRSVVGTMWEMADTDGRDLAKNFYKSLFSGQDSGVPYYERSAEALRDATQKLRGKRGITLERWVNFVHYGA
ncbi:CHAT domain containing protein [Lactarius tabidus]